jgi:hypothetical protein
LVPVNAPFGANGTARFTEQHAVADFAVGRDVGLGFGQAQLKAGLRIAEISSNMNGSANFVAPTSFTVTAGPLGARPGVLAVQQQSRFTGAGPRAALEGTVPLAGAWAVDYLGGTAVLYGARSFNIAATSGNGANFGITNFGSSDGAAVFNLEAQIGLSYWFNPGLKLTASYRFDGYWGVLKTLNSDGTLGNSDRFYSGPMLRLTAVLN